MEEKKDALEEEVKADEAEGFADEPILVLTDDETGEEKEYVLRASQVINGVLYYALKPADEEGEEYGILRVTEVGDDVILETVDDDDEFETVEDYFNDLFFSEIDYDD